MKKQASIELETHVYGADALPLHQTAVDQITVTVFI